MYKLSAALGTLVLIGAAATTAWATAPGQNGQLAFRRYLDSARSTGPMFVANADGSRVRQITHPAHGVVDQEADWSPNGQKIAFERKTPCPTTGPRNGLDGTCDVVYTVRRDGSSLKALVACDFAQRCHGVNTPAWSPDGSKIAYRYGLSNPSFVDSLNYDAGIWIAAANGKSPHQVTQLMPGTSWDTWPQWSPDGSKLVFVREDLESKANALYTVKVDGTELSQVTPWKLNGGQGPDWSPDMKWLVFTSEPANGSANVYEVHPDGSGLTNLTKQGPKGFHYLSSSFSPDGRMIVTARTPGAGPDGAADLVVMNVNGSHVRAITKTRLWESGVDWGPRISTDKKGD